MRQTRILREMHGDVVRENKKHGPDIQDAKRSLDCDKWKGDPLT